MKEAKHNSVNRIFPQPTPQKQEERVRELLMDASQRRRANKEIDGLLRLFHGRKTILQLLPAMKQRNFPMYVIKVAIERAKRRLADDDFTGKAELMAFEASLAEVG